MRGAFKVISDGKQVAVLLLRPCWRFNILDLQETVCGLPAKIEMLSRFSNGGRAEENMAELEAGKVDVVIGTHRLLFKRREFSGFGFCW